VTEDQPSQQATDGGPNPNYRGECGERMKVTLEDIEASIAHEVFFTAYQGACMATSEPIPGELGMVTICAMTLHNGHRIIGVNEGPVSPEIFDAGIGRQYARQKAIDQIWPLLGYELRSYLHAMSGPRTSGPEGPQDLGGVDRSIPTQPVESGGERGQSVGGLQPIETAPTDGTVFLGYRQRDGRWGECFRIQRDDCEMWSFGGGSAADEEFPYFKPTHWMPLPADTSTP